MEPDAVCRDAVSRRLGSRTQPASARRQPTSPSHRAARSQQTGRPSPRATFLLLFPHIYFCNLQNKPTPAGEKHPRPLLKVCVFLVKKTFCNENLHGKWNAPSSLADGGKTRWHRWCSGSSACPSAWVTREEFVLCPAQNGTSAPLPDRLQNHTNPVPYHTRLQRAGQRCCSPPVSGPGKPRVLPPPATDSPFLMEICHLN